LTVGVVEEFTLKNFLICYRYPLFIPYLLQYFSAATRALSPLLNGMIFVPVPLSSSTLNK
jgi:hypothetical protein